MKSYAAMRDRLTKDKNKPSDKQLLLS